MLKSDRWTTFGKKIVKSKGALILARAQDPTMTEYFCRLHLPHTHTKSRFIYEKEKNENGKTAYAYSKKNFKILFKKKALVSIRTRSRLNHHYETHQYEALYFAFMLSASN